jgi:transcriptional regulator with XRE-family HTH domain
VSSERKTATTGIAHLDRILGGLSIGDNVIWYDDAGSLAPVFWRNLLRASVAAGRPLIYVSFDRSPNNLLQRLGGLAHTPLLTVLDAFSHGKGAGAEVFLRFYEESPRRLPCRVQPIREPARMEAVSEAFFGVHERLDGEVRFVFESLTGMQELWGGEEEVARFYSRACPRLYELETVAYWLIERQAHSQRLRAQINQIAQVALDLTVRRGKTFLTVLKAEDRDPGNLGRPFPYWVREEEVVFEAADGPAERFPLGGRIRAARTRRGFSQSRLARQVGVSPSTISQVESGQIHPSLPALFRIAETLQVRVSSLFEEADRPPIRSVFRGAEGASVSLPEMSGEGISVELVTPLHPDAGAELYRMEIAPGWKRSEHFFRHKRTEIGYLLEGSLTLTVDGASHTIGPGDGVVLTRQLPTRWANPGPDTARLLWLVVG